MDDITICFLHTDINVSLTQPLNIVHVCEATGILIHLWRYSVASGGCRKPGDVLPTDGDADDVLKSVYGIVLACKHYILQ